MTHALVTYETKSGTYTSSMIWSNTGLEELESIRDTAERKAARYGYTLIYVDEITEREVERNIRRGMSYSMIDDQAEIDHDPSIIADIPAEETEEPATEEPAEADTDTDIIDAATADAIPTEYRYHHTASARGYISRRAEPTPESYTGKYGHGYIVRRPRWDTTRYHYVTYYIKEATA